MLALQVTQSKSTASNSRNTNRRFTAAQQERNVTKRNWNLGWLACERNHSCTSSCDPALSATCMLEAYIEWPLAGGRRLWTQLMPGAYTDDGSAGAVLGERVPWFVCMPRDTRQRERLYGMDRMGVCWTMDKCDGSLQYSVGDCSSILNRCVEVAITGYEVARPTSKS